RLAGPGEGPSHQARSRARSGLRSECPAAQSGGAGAGNHPQDPVGQAAPLHDERAGGLLRQESAYAGRLGRVTARRRVQHVPADDAVARPETLAVEEPLEIRVNGTPITVTMRTPGSDIELAHGFLLTEGVVACRDDVLTVRYCKGASEDGVNTYNVLDVTLAPGHPDPDRDVPRNFYTTSSCGICGKASRGAVRLISRHCPGDDPSTVAAETLSAMPSKLRAAQKAFASTGGLHGAALFGADGTV